MQRIRRAGYHPMIYCGEGPTFASPDFSGFADTPSRPPQRPCLRPGASDGGLFPGWFFPRHNRASFRCIWSSQPLRFCFKRFSMLSNGLQEGVPSCKQVSLQKITAAVLKNCDLYGILFLLGTACKIAGRYTFLQNLFHERWR